MNTEFPLSNHEATELPDKIACAHCGSMQPVGFRFCSSCGKRNAQKSLKERKRNLVQKKHLNSLLTYAILSIVLLLIVAITGESVGVLVFWTLCFALVDLFFAAYQPDIYYQLYNLRKIKLWPLLSIIFICITSGFVVSFSMSKLNLILFDIDPSMTAIFRDLDHGLLYAILLIAVAPAIFEELAFRGFVFNNFKYIGGKKSAIWGSAFLFALVHFSLISLVWILPFGLLLAFYRNRYSTLLYGMVGHFTHNLTSLLIDHYGLF